jgi:hypothetical protein
MVNERSYIVPNIKALLRYLVSLLRHIELPILYLEALLLAHPSSLSVPGALNQSWLASHIYVTYIPRM